MKPLSFKRHRFPAGYLMKNRYDVELVRDGKVWVIARSVR